jgi:hypothetical protein
MTPQTLGQLAREEFHAALLRKQATKEPFESIWVDAMEEAAAAVARRCIRIMQLRADGYESCMADTGLTAKLRDICTRKAITLQSVIDEIEDLIAEGVEDASGERAAA